MSTWPDYGISPGESDAGDAFIGMSPDEDWNREALAQEEYDEATPVREPSHPCEFEVEFYSARLGRVITARVEVDTDGDVTVLTHHLCPSDEATARDLGHAKWEGQ